MITEEQITNHGFSFYGKNGGFKYFIKNQMGDTYSISYFYPQKIIGSISVYKNDGWRKIKKRIENESELTESLQTLNIIERQET